MAVGGGEDDAQRGFQAAEPGASGAEKVDDVICDEEDAGGRVEGLVAGDVFGYVLWSGDHPGT